MTGGAVRFLFRSLGCDEKRPSHTSGRVSRTRAIQSDYLEVVDKEAAMNWFSILPTTPLNVLPLVSAEEQKVSETPTNAAAST